MTRPHRPVFMEVADLPRPEHDLVAIVRAPDYTLLRVQQGGFTPTIISDIAYGLEGTEAPGWLGPFGHSGPVDLAAVAASPVLTLGQALTSIPALSRCIPRPLRTPWSLCS